MKRLFQFLVLLSASLLRAQNPIPNPGFENWSGGNPVSWNTANILTLTPVSQSNQSHSGNSAAKLEVLSAFGAPIPPSLFSNSININQNYQTFSYYYKASLNAGDIFVLGILIYKNGGQNGGRLDTLKSTNNSNIYVQRNVTLLYPSSALISDEMDISFAIGGSGGTLPTVGSNAIIDDLTLSGGAPTSLTELEGIIQSGLGAAEPNPSSSFCLLPFSVKEKGPVEINLYDGQGRLIKQILNEELGSGRYKAECDLTGLSSGLYVTQACINGLKFTSKLIVE